MQSFLKKEAGSKHEKQLLVYNKKNLFLKNVKESETLGSPYYRTKTKLG
jgi:hypothetical protein